jgi:uncharacterized protein YqjF (DUF2071 family)
MRMRWRDLLFLHWEVSAEIIRPTLPPGIEPDLHEGRAFLGIVPFVMAGVRPAFLPAVPGISDFPELNLRTYVRDRAGVPGVWFYSLDASQRLAVAIARRFFHLPYHAARMDAVREGTGALTHRSRRRVGGAESRFAWTPGEMLPAPQAGSLEHFLVERYRFYATDGARLLRGAVAHPPYPLRRAMVTTCQENLFAAAGFSPAGRGPDHVVCSDGVEVEAFGLERVGPADPREDVP